MKPSVLKYAVAEVADEVESGSTLSDALGKHPKIFDRLYVNMIKAGEAGGVLDTILERLSEFMEKSLRLRKKVIGAMIYPVVVIVVAAGILRRHHEVGGARVPQDVRRDEAANARCRPPCSRASPTSSPTTSCSCSRCPWWRGSPTGSSCAAKAGACSSTASSCGCRCSAPSSASPPSPRFCRTLGTLVASGVPILEALAIVKETTGNAVVTKAVEDVHNSIREGESIARPLGASGGVRRHHREHGRHSARRPESWTRCSSRSPTTYEDDVDVAVESLTSVLEPLLIVVLGGAVGFIVVALFLPLITILEGIK
ncbi:MAG: hypothetical protein KatS3mg102_0913 [Planctomycetota bacterium]|nr:MAG: hypothetical protein KatS3mg102_0913 [Planctomycetota bacterium]